MRKTVIETTVGSGLCIGCGACASVCPRKRLDLAWNENGGYSAVESSEACAEGCALCTKVCPFSAGNPNEDELASALFGGSDASRHAPGMGYYLGCYVGHVREETRRLNGASGGLTTWFLASLLRESLVDHVICVQPCAGPKSLFKYVVCDTENEVYESSRSAYYPVELSGVLRQLQSVDGRYAIVCLPCMAKAMRLAAEAVPRISRRLVCVVGLTCGHGASAFFADYAASLAGTGSSPLTNVTFRTKSPEFDATELGVRCEWKSGDGVEAKTIYWSHGLADAWSGCWFAPNPCLYCDDVFAETADVAFMDAWLPRYSADYRGTNLVIVRSPLAEKAVLSGIDSGQIECAPVSPDDVIRSQAQVVEDKREGLAHRLWQAGRAHLVIPPKRVAPARSRHPFSVVRWNAQVKSSGIGGRIWRECRDAEELRLRMGAELHVENQLLRLGERWARTRSALGSAIRSLMGRHGRE